MKQHERQLYERLVAFEFDEPGAELTFAARLARENGWSQSFAERVIGEYRKFAFLAVAAGHPVCPSDQIDAAWHLHLTYTRSYWHGFCALLGKPLHHSPTKGGPAELEKHLGWYEQTLSSYRRLFGLPPPGDIWPAPAERFYLGRGHRRVDLNANWVIPKPRLRHLGGLIITAAALGPAAGMTLNPFNFNGRTFILLYLVLLVIAVMVAAWLRWSLRGNASSAADETLDPYETAYLAGGKRLAVHAALASLVDRGVLVVRREGKEALRFFNVNLQYRVAAKHALSDDAADLEKSVFRAAGPGETVAEIHEAAGVQATRLAERLRRNGWLLDETRAAQARWWPALLIIALGIIGAIKIAVGVSRGRPVGFLIAAVIGTFIVAALFLRDASRSRAGDRLLADLRERHARLNAAAHGPAHDLPAAELVLATALFGMAVVAGGPLDDLRAALRAPRSQGGGGGGGCASGCGGDGCGGGGCGGGCGGCS